MIVDPRLREDDEEGGAGMTRKDARMTLGHFDYVQRGQVRGWLRGYCISISDRFL